MIDIAIVKILAGGDVKHFSTVGCRQKLTFTVEQFQGVPLCGVMTSGDDDTAVGFIASDYRYGTDYPSAAIYPLSEKYWYGIRNCL